MNEKVWMKLAQVIAGCDVHDWPTDGMGSRFVAEMRRKHGKGGVNVCIPCLERAAGDAKEKSKQADRTQHALDRWLEEGGR